MKKSPRELMEEGMKEAIQDTSNVETAAKQAEDILGAPELLQLPATISNVKTMTNRALRLQVDTQEGLEDEQIQKIISVYDQFGWFTFLRGKTKISSESVANLPDLPKDDSEVKTPSQRLRARLWTYYKATRTELDGFNAWYADVLDKIGQKYLDKID